MLSHYIMHSGIERIVVKIKDTINFKKYIVKITIYLEKYISLCRK